MLRSGLGVCNLNSYLSEVGLICKGGRQCLVICTHCHFDHAGGAHHFPPDQVYLHRLDAADLQTGRQTSILNYVKPTHFHQQPYRDFAACRYRVPPTNCTALTADQVLSMAVFRVLLSLKKLSLHQESSFNCSVTVTEVRSFISCRM